MRYRKEIDKIPPYIPGKSKEGAIKLASNENPLGTSPKAVERMRQIIDNVSLYPDQISYKLRIKLADKYNLKPENFIIGNGSDEIMSLIAGAFIEYGDNAIISKVTFSKYEISTLFFGGIPKFVPLLNGVYNLEEMLTKIDNRTKLIFLCNPNNPTGTYFPHNKLLNFIRNVPKDIIIIIDEAYGEYVEAEDFPNSISILEKYSNIIILKTFSKIYGMAGLRLGYGISNPDLIKILYKIKEPFNVNYIAHEAGIAALDDIEFVKKSIELNKNGKYYLYNELNKLNLKYYPTQANFIYIELEKNCIEVFEKLMDMGIVIRPLNSFGVDNSIRVTIGTQSQNEFFINCLRKIL